MNYSRVVAVGASLFTSACLIAACSSTPPAYEEVAQTKSELAITGLFATGVNNSNQLLLAGVQDPHYSLIASADPTFTGPATFVLDPLLYPLGVGGPWVANNSTSQWISIRPGGGGTGVNGSYTYRTTFTLANVDPASATLTGTWACDDDCTLRLNGTNYVTRTNAYGSLTTFTVNAGSNFVVGTNNLDIVVANSGGGPTGIRIATISGSAVCTQDSQCGNGNYCNNISLNPAVCAAKLPNGQTVPGGTCTGPIGTRACVSAVCDTTDNKCGFVDGKGPCTPQNGATVCRSGTCSTNGGVCVPTNGCAVDSDCGVTQWCNISTFTCTAKVPNGTIVPTDPKHVTPTLNGTCNGPAAVLTCVSGVCDTTDNKCGFVDGNGPCTPQNGTTVCRSGTCSTNGGVCVPANGCAVDSDCGVTQWCNISTFTCTPKVPNGNPVPTDPGHITPTLDGKCGGPAAILTCVSGVCDPKDDKCGLLSGTGPCTSQNGTTVCRSGVCGQSGVCIDVGTCLTDGDCPGQWCNVSQKKCTPKVPNSSPMPTDPGHVTPTVDGKCGGDAAKVVCVSSVCDTDDACGLKNGTPCDTKIPAQCRSAFCATDGKCGKPDGETCTGNPDCRNANCVGGICGGPKTPDGGAPDGGVDSGTPAQSDGVILEGGGVGCNASGGGTSGLSLLAGIAMAIAAIRRRR